MVTKTKVKTRPPMKPPPKPKLVKPVVDKREAEKKLQRKELEKLFGDPDVPIWEKRLMAKAFRKEYGG